MRRVLVLLFIGVLAACKGKQAPSQEANVPPQTSSSMTAPAATNGTEAPLTSTESAVAPEVNPPGDIPDSQAFVRFTSAAGGYSVEVPEGWARSENGPNATFVDKLDGVRATITASSTAPTAATAPQNEGRQIQQSGRAVQITSIKDANLPSGPAVVISYTSNSDSNPVTNKQVRLENQTYLYFKNGKEAALTLWAPKGADNVDQWNRMSKSFQWR